MLLTSGSKSDVGIGLIRLLSIQPTSVLDVRCEFHHSYGGRVGLCERHCHRLRGHLPVVAHGGRLEAVLVSRITAIGERSCRQTPCIRRSLQWGVEANACICLLHPSSISN